MFIELTKENGEAFINLRFCSIALTKNKVEKRDHITHLMIKDSVCYGTDGKRLHVAACELNDGMYKVLKCTKTMLQITSIDIDMDCYPNFSDIVGLPYTDDSLWVKHDDADIDGAYFLIADIIRALPEDECINYHMIEDILKGDYFTAYTCKDGDNPIILVAGDKKAFIMPIKCH